MSVLDEIFAHKRQEVTERKRVRPLEQLMAEADQAAPPLNFVAALRQADPKPALIAEVKQASPSRGLLAPDFDPLRLAQLYLENGASAVSVLTDERYFKGHLDYLRQIRQLHPDLPLLRKDFIYDPYQVYEARAAGADAILLIAAALEAKVLFDLHQLARDLGLAPLVEVHTRAELEQVLPCRPVLVGVNNRDLHDFTVRLETTLALRPFAPAEVCFVAESGIHTPADVARLAQAGVDAILVGEALVVAADVAAQVRSLSGAKKKVVE